MTNKSKFVQVIFTEKQIAKLRESAELAGISLSELIRRDLIAQGTIPEDDINRGGYRERKPKVKKS